MVLPKEEISLFCPLPCTKQSQKGMGVPPKKKKWHNKSKEVYSRSDDIVEKYNVCLYISHNIDYLETDIFPFNKLQ